MNDNLVLQDKNYISAKRASEIFGYATDYIGQLCRSEKIDAKMIGRSWFVSYQSLLDYQSGSSVVVPSSASVPSYRLKLTFACMFCMLSISILILTLYPNILTPAFENLNDNLTANVLIDSAGNLGVNGLVVAPSSGSADVDNDFKEQVRNTFSDEVMVSPDETGTSGVVTPIFRDARGSDYIYVMVPVNEK